MFLCCPRFPVFWNTFIIVPYKPINLLVLLWLVLSYHQSKRWLHHWNMLLHSIVLSVATFQDSITLFNHFILVFPSIVLLFFHPPVWLHGLQFVLVSFLMHVESQHYYHSFILSLKGKLITLTVPLYVHALATNVATKQLQSSNSCAHEYLLGALTRTTSPPDKDRERSAMQSVSSILHRPPTLQPPPASTPWSGPLPLLTPAARHVTSRPAGDGSDPLDSCTPRPRPTCIRCWDFGTFVWFLKSNPLALESVFIVNIPMSKVLTGTLTDMVA